MEKSVWCAVIGYVVSVRCADDQYGVLANGPYTTMSPVISLFCIVVQWFRYEAQNDQ